MRGMARPSRGEHVSYLVKCSGVAVGESNLAHGDPVAGVLKDEFRSTAEFDRRRARVLAGQDLELLDATGALVPTRSIRVRQNSPASRSQEIWWLEVSLADARTLEMQRRCG
jgi:hypothetical protein